MRSPSVQLWHCLLGIVLLAACSPTPAPTAASGHSPLRPVPTATPFQPGEVDPPGPEVGDREILPTFTPLSAVALLPTAPATPSVLVEGAATPSSSAEINPLTGVAAPDPGLLNRRPMVIKISNYPREIRPQYGLNEADVVYEYYIEWADTRFIGVFYGQDAEQIGPVRSGRYFDEHITRMYQAYYVFNFADPREYSYYLGGDLQPFMVVPGYGTCPPFFEHKVSENISDVRHYEMYFDSTRFGACLARKSADNSRPVLRNGFFSPVEPAAGTSVRRIFTHYSTCDYNYWEYDPPTGAYLRYQETSTNKDPKHLNDCVDKPETYAPLVDALMKKQVRADNIVVIYVPHTFSSQDEQDDEIYHINLVDSGKAYVFRDGVGIPARWLRTDINQPLLLTTPDGMPIYLKPGRTFFEVLGSTSTDWSDDADWHFEFSTP
jgi:Protein of unknown function (DUF3048) N-terminal domain/Protein of unknown function (DUF3048) C-terminal domain